MYNIDWKDRGVEIGTKSSNYLYRGEMCSVHALSTDCIPFPQDWGVFP